MAFKYRVNTNDAAAMADYARTMDKRATRQGGNFQGIIRDDYRTWRPAKGDNFIRILPPTWEDAQHYGIDVFVHYNVGPDRATVLCLNQMQRKPCPICQAKMRADREKDEELAKALGARSQTLVWMVDLKDKAKGPLVWAMAFTTERDIAKLSKDRQTGELFLLDHPEEGYNISFDRDGEALHTKYSGWQIGKRPSAIEPAWLQFVIDNPLPDCLVWRDYDEVQALFTGGSSRSDGDDRPARRPDPESVMEELRARAKPKPEPEPEPEVETEAEAEPAPEEKVDPPWEATPEVKPEVKSKPAASGKSKAEALRERFKK